MTSLLDGPPTQEQIDQIEALLVERKAVYSKPVIRQGMRTMGSAGALIRGLRNCPRK